MADQKVCSSCDKEKPLSDFRKPAKCGRVYKICKSCDAASDKAWRLRNPELKRANTQRDYKKNRPRYKAAGAAYRARRHSAEPKWLSPTQKLEIRAFYEVSSWHSEPTHVDHIVPLKGVNVCGLHVPWNLQVIPAQLNQIKYNKAI